jgi:hypothetical protein
MNLEQALPLWWIFCILCGIILEVIGFQGMLFWGFIIGIAPLGLGLVTLLLILILSVFYKDFPICVCGSCSSQDYIFLHRDSSEAPSSYYKCPSCHRCYRLKGNIVFELISGGTERPYMRQSRFGQWHPYNR